MAVQKRPFGKTPEGVQAEIFTLSNENGVSAEITNYGGTIVRLCVPDRYGNLSDITLGYDTLEGYVQGGAYFGALIGRHANRIEDAKFELNGKEYTLFNNNGKNQLHGGKKGFDKVMWKPATICDKGRESLKLEYLSADGEESYPGNLEVTVLYTLSAGNELVIEYFAVTDKDTVVNLTNHAYFNFKGHQCGSIAKHQIRINADRFTAINSEGLPTGEIREAKGTPLDLSRLREIGASIDSADEQMVFAKGYDHNFILNCGGSLNEKAAEAYEPVSGRAMEVYTTMPGIQFYSGNFLNGEKGKGGAVYGHRSGFCLETQYFPNSMKHRHFPSPVLKAGNEYKHTTVYKFSAR